jgi:ubiquinone/menaquinone biosynthesis C-methylase UbiE
MGGAFLFYLYTMKDNFSTQAGNYARYRPAYPSELFEFLLSHVNGREAAWDCATGNGQTAVELAKSFRKVFATDISQKQLDKAEQKENILYSMLPAEQTPFEDDMFDLVTVSQALHWLRFDSFYSEVKRVTKPGGLLAVWVYSLLRISSPIDTIIAEQFYKDTLHGYWDSERKHVDDNYSNIPFPFEEIKTPGFLIRFEWTLEELAGYLNTWSAVQKFISRNEFDPVPEAIEKIKPLWTERKMKIIFPVTMRIGRIRK